MTRKEWIYVGSAGVIALGGVLWYAHRQASSAAANQAAQDQAMSAISSAMGQGGISPYYGMSGGGSYIPEAGQVTSTTPAATPTTTTSGSGSGSSGSDPILQFLEAYMTSNASSQQSSLNNEISSLQGQLRQAQAQAGEVGGLNSQVSSLTAQLQNAQSQLSQMSGIQGQLSSANQQIASLNGILGQVRAYAQQAAAVPNSSVGNSIPTLQRILG